MMKAIGAALLAILASGSAPAQDPRTQPPGFTMGRIGDIRDFDFMEGGWTTVQHRLRAGADGESWEVQPATLCMRHYLDGGATVDELFFPTQGWSGLTLRTFDREKKQWSIYWVNRIGRLDPIPVVGGFAGKRGEFYALDRIDGRPVKVRYLWLVVDRDHARWEQALSFDDREWKTNWTADFTRGDAGKLCADGRPRR